MCRFSGFIFQLPQVVRDSGASKDKPFGQSGRKTWLLYQKEGLLGSDSAIPEISDQMGPDRKESWLPPKAGDDG